MSVKKRTILVSPLDWGLGHATRCIPIIQELVRCNCHVIIGGSGHSGLLLKQEFPTLSYVEVPSATIKYSKTSAGFFWKMIQQVPAVIKQNKNEKKWLADFIEKNNVDAVIADNRYGLHSTKITSILITHQVYVKTGANKIVDWLFNKLINYPLLNKFQSVWVPDNKDEFILGGTLSHPKHLPAVPINYIGALNRFKSKNKNNATNGKILILLSGPEPQRTLLEEILIEQLVEINNEIDFVRGLPASNQKKENRNSITFYNHLDTESLFKKIDEAEIVITRSGYTSVMELLPLSKKCIFIPTPGQAEQEYLAKFHMQSGRALYFAQNKFSLKTAISQGKNQVFHRENGWPASQLPHIIKNWLNNIKA
jgi:uncharacterized protein (TIGR00661 family)